MLFHVLDTLVGPVWLTRHELQHLWMLVQHHSTVVREDALVSEDALAGETGV